MKVLHGMSEVAGQGIYSVKGLRANGVSADMAVWRPNTFDYPIDISLNIGKKKYLYPWYAFKMFVFFLGATFKYDCFHFHYAHSLLPFGLDLMLLKSLNKKIFFEFHGSELRGQINNIKYPYFHNISQVKRQSKLIKKEIEYADGIILHDIELKPHLPDTNIPIHIVPLRVDLSRLTPVFPDVEVKKPVVVHAPSNRGSKGSNWIIEAANKLKDQIDFVLVENKSQDEAIEIYKKADIIIDQISVGAYGVFAIECMALGKPVLSYISDEVRNSLPDTCPIQNIEPDTIYDVLNKLSCNPDLRRNIGIQGRKYVEEYHDYTKNAKLLKDIYEGHYKR